MNINYYLTKNNQIVMKKLFKLTGAIAIFSLMAFVGKNMHTDVYNVDPKQSTLEWYAEKVTGKHNGTIMFSNGEIKNDHGKLSGSFEIDMTTIEDKDMSAEDKRSKLNNHLKSEDFFNVAKYPRSKFVITSVTPLKAVSETGMTHNVKGNLTIKDKTNEVSFDTGIKMMDNKVTATGSIVVDRSKFDIKYNSKSFFPDIGEKMIYDEFTLKFNIVAVK